MPKLRKMVELLISMGPAGCCMAEELQDHEGDQVAALSAMSCMYQHVTMVMEKLSFALRQMPDAKIVAVGDNIILEGLTDPQIKVLEDAQMVMVTEYSEDEYSEFMEALKSDMTSYQELLNEEDEDEGAEVV